MKLYTILFSVLFFATICSCTKTSTCTYTDPVTGDIITDTVKTAKSLHSEAVYQHTKNGWTCQ